MNYLKKKLKSHKRGHEDPEDFEDYIPVAPPHPSEVLKKQQEEEALKNASPEQLAALEEKKRQEEDRQRAKEEAKKNSEGWQFFEALSAKVSSTVQQSQTVIDKVKDSTLADELTKQAEIELGFLDPEPEEEVQRGASFGKGQWVGFEEGAAFDDLPGQSSEPTAATDENPPANLLDDFLGPSEPVPVEEDPEDDIFDTKFVDVSLVEAKAAEEAIAAEKRKIEEEIARKVEAERARLAKELEEARYTPAPIEDLPDPEPEEEEKPQSRRTSEVEEAAAISLVNTDNLDLDPVAEPTRPESDMEDEAQASVPQNHDDGSDEELDPEVKDCDPAVISLYKHGKKVLSKFGSNTSLASILSNPFLNEEDIDITGMRSGAATPSRRGSALGGRDSPQDDHGAGISADAIAALTEDFCKAISDDPTASELVESPQEPPPKPKPPRPELPPAEAAAPPKPPPPSVPPAPAAAAVPEKPAPPVVPPAPVAAVPEKPAPPVVPPAPAAVPAKPPPPVIASSNPEPEPEPESPTEAPLSPPAAEVTAPTPVELEPEETIEPATKQEIGWSPFETIRDDHSDHSGSNRPSLSADGGNQDAPSIPDYPSDQEDAFDQRDEVPDERRRSSAFKSNDSNPVDPATPPTTLPEIRRSSVPPDSSPDDDSYHWEQKEKQPEEVKKAYFDPLQQIDDGLSPTTPDPPEHRLGALDVAYTAHIDEHSEREDNDIDEPEPPAVEAEKEEAAPTTAAEEIHEEVDEESNKPPEEPAGIVNEGFEDQTPADEKPPPSEEMAATQDYEASMSPSGAAFSETNEMADAPAVTTSSDTAAVIEGTDATGAHDHLDQTTGGSDSGLGIGAFDDTDPGRDPFDTSDFSFEPVQDAVPYTDNATFDNFSSRFDQQRQAGATAGAESSSIDPFASPMHLAKGATAAGGEAAGFDGSFDPFLTDHIKPPKNTPIKLQRAETGSDFSDSDDEPHELKVVIKAKMRDGPSDRASLPLAPLLPPPPKTPTKLIREVENYQPNEYEGYDSVLKAKRAAAAAAAMAAAEAKANEPPEEKPKPKAKRTESIETPSTPLYDEDISQPLEEYPVPYSGEGWEMFIRHPAKKKITANRFWKKIFVRVTENEKKEVVIQLYNKKEDNEPFQEVPLQPSYSLSEISAQQYDQFGKIFTVKIQYVFFRERVGVRKGQIAKVIQGQIQSVGQIKSLGMPLEHAPQISELVKLGSLNYDDVRAFEQVVEEAQFRTPLSRDRALTYKTEEIQMTMQDEIYIETNKMGIMTKQLARVRLFLIAFINGMPGMEIGINDIRRQGNEVVGRHDIMPITTEEWIRVENYELHSTIMKEEFDNSRVLKLVPPDAVYFELMRFRVRPPKNRELPLQVSTNMYISKINVEIKCEVLVPGCVSRKHGPIPCEDIAIRIHIPEAWIYWFRNEKHLRYGSVKSSNRRYGKIKGLERFLGAAGTTNFEPSLLETSAGQAKYEHVHHSLVWRIPRLPKEGQGAYTQQTLLMRMPLTSFDQVPESFYEFVHVEFSMPATTVSHAVVRSVSVTSEEPPEKYVKYIAKYEMKTILSITHTKEQNDYAIAAAVSTPRKPSITEEPAAPAPAPEEPDEEESDSE